ncbi:MAG: hypothetical protein FJX62_05310 [Alphaproteobacteria bacterium]|nr:hypothetical protein [Alphaproteobacteria bacterium]
MIHRWPLAVALAILTAQTAAAAPKPAKPQKECPHAISDPEAIVKTIGKAATCTESMEIFEACAYGASGDTEFGDAVIGRCERDFLATLGPQQKRAYEAERKACDRKYAKKSGSMYVSFTAFCHAGVAQKYSLRATRTPPRR